MEYSKQSVPIPKDEKDAALAQIFKDKFLNFVDSKGVKDMYIFSNTDSINSTTSTKIFSNKLNRRSRRPMTMGKNPSSPKSFNRISKTRGKNKKNKLKLNNTANGVLKKRLIHSRELVKEDKN
mmetsp:Transcript_779/g.649  ORF Transcript_779/g.649 Transcript_779/m.649 type:complete len:123 (+) Transcript_779:488-856(+)